MPYSIAAAGLGILENDCYAGLTDKSDAWLSRLQYSAPTRPITSQYQATAPLPYVPPEYKRLPVIGTGYNKRKQKSALPDVATNRAIGELARHIRPCAHGLCR